MKSYQPYINGKWKDSVTNDTISSYNPYNQIIWTKIPDMNKIDIANNSIYGLAAGIWTKDIQKAHRTALELTVGNVWINTYRTSAVGSLFRGQKQSGYERYALYEYTQMKNVMVNLSDSSRSPFSMQT